MKENLKEQILKKLPFLFPIYVFAGLFFRCYQLKNELLFDGSLVEGAYMHRVLIALSLIVPLAFALSCWTLKKLRCHSSCFTDNGVWVSLQIIAGVGLIGSNLLQFGQELPPFFMVTRMSTLLVESLPWLGIAAGLCVIAFAILCKCHRTPSPLLYMLVSIYLVVRLIVRFQNWNTDPSIHDYAYELLAAICTMLGCFQVAGFGFNKGKRAITAFWCSCAVFFTGISLADALEDLPELCALLSLLILSFTMAIQLLYAREDIEEPAEEETSAKELTEEDTPADLPPEDHSPEF